jgi:ABC-type multidrug transport system, ATPase component
VPSPDSAVRVTDLIVRFGGRAVLDGLSLVASTGALTAVLGPNGAGKTTLIRCCTGLIPPTAGTIDVLGLPRWLSTAGRSDRAHATKCRILVRNQGARAVALFGGSSTPIHCRYLHLSNAWGSPNARRPHTGACPGGQQQAVNLAGALVGRPEVVFLDEPTAGMDPHARRATWLLMRELRANGVDHAAYDSCHG